MACRLPRVICRAYFSTARLQNRCFYNQKCDFYCASFSNQFYFNNILFGHKNATSTSIFARQWSNINDTSNNTPKPGIVARFKQMYKDYWYVLVPVHLVTSVCWFGGFYYLAKSGVDVVALLKALGLSDSLVNPLKDSSMGYVALAYALYKVATPVRYTITLGGTTISIKYLKQWGYIKPMPSREQLKEMYVETKQELRQRKDQIRERKDNVIKDIARYKQEMREVKENECKNK